MENKDNIGWRGTTVVSVRKKNEVVIAADGQVTLGDTVIKANAKKVRSLSDGKVLTGFAGATADAFTLFERLELKLEKTSNNLMRACVELAKDWRTDRYLRRLEAMMLVADKDISLILSGNGDVLEPNDGLMAIDKNKSYTWVHKQRSPGYCPSTPPALPSTHLTYQTQARGARGGKNTNFQESRSVYGRSGSCDFLHK